MNKNGHSHAMHFCPVRRFRDHTGSIRATGSMAWNSILKQRLQLQVTNQRGVPPLKTFPIHQHGSSSPNTDAYSNGMLQGRSFKDSRNLSEKTSKKSFTAKKAFLIACGVRCVLSPRPSNCSTSSPHKDERDRPHSTSARRQKCSRDCFEKEGELRVWESYTAIKRTEDRERARSGTHRPRVPLDSTTRPSTVPLENQMRRRALSTPETPMCKIVWRKKDDQNVLQNTHGHFTESNLTPSLHLYLPTSYHPQDQGEDTAAGQDNSSSEVHENQDVTEELGEHDITMESQKQDITINKTEDEGHNDFTDVTRYDITDTCRNDTQNDTPEETFESDMMEERRQQDDNRQQETTESQCDIGRSFNIIEDKPEYVVTEDEPEYVVTEDEPEYVVTEDKAEYVVTEDKPEYVVTEDEPEYVVTEDEPEYVVTEKTEGIYRRTISISSSYKAFDDKTRSPATATPLTFPSTQSSRNPFPSVSVLPSFYRTSFGYRFSSTSEACRSKTRTRKACDDSRFTRQMNDMRHTIEIKGNPCLLKTRAGAPGSPNPKIMSTDRGSQPHKIKTTKTFLWGPEGPHETKTVCELESHVNRWRSLN